MKKANEQITDTKTQAIAVTNWTLASRAIYYNREYNSSVYLIDNRKDQFDIWEQTSPIKKDLIVINTHFFKKDISTYMKCEEVLPLTEFDIILNKNKVNTIKFTTCKNFQGLR